MKRAYKYRFYPTPEQADLLNRTFGSVRYVYNRALAERSRAWTQEQQRVTFAETCRMLTAWKNDPDTGVAVRGVQRRPAAGPAASPERLRELLGQAGEVPAVQVQAQVAGVGDVHHARGSGTGTGRSGWRRCPRRWRSCWSRPLPEGAEPSTVTVSRDAAGRWHISILVRVPRRRRCRRLDRSVGIDAGITSLVTLSTGEKVTNPRHERRDRARLAKAQRHCPASRKAPRTGPRPGSRWPGSTPGSPTGAATSCTSCPRGSSARTKR